MLSTNVCLERKHFTNLQHIFVDDKKTEGLEFWVTGVRKQKKELNVIITKHFIVITIYFSRFTVIILSHYNVRIYQVITENFSWSYNINIVSNVVIYCKNIKKILLI